MNSSVEQLIDTLEIEAYAHVVKRLLFKTIMVVLGYDIYFLGHCRNYYTECPLDWACAASDLESVYNDRDDWLVRDSACPFDAKSKLTQKIRIMSFYIGAELFEDFDENGYRDSFVQKIGRLAQDCEDDLSNLLPAFNTDIMVVYKIALLDVINILNNI